MKKYAALLLFSVFLISFVATAYAHSDDAGKHMAERLNKEKANLGSVISEAKKLENLDDHQLKALQKMGQFRDKMNMLDREKLEKLSNLPPAVAKRLAEGLDMGSLLGNMSMKRVAKIDVMKAFEKREIAEDRVMEAEGRLMQARERLKNATDDLKLKKADFLRTKSIEDARSYLIKVIDALDARVNKLKESAQSSSSISENKSQEIVAALNNTLTKIDGWKAKVQSAATKDDIKAILKEIREAWAGHMEHVMKMHGWRLALEHFGGILKQVEQLDNKLNRWIDFAENNNITIPDKEAKVGNFEASLSEARKYYEASVDSFKKLKASLEVQDVLNTTAAIAERQGLINSIQGNHTLAADRLKEAREVLNSLAKGIAAAFKGKGVETDDGNVVEPGESKLTDPAAVTEGVDSQGGQVTIVQQEGVEL